MGYTVFKMPSGPQYSTLATLGMLHSRAFMQASHIRVSLSDYYYNTDRDGRTCDRGGEKNLGMWINVAI